MRIIHHLFTLSTFQIFDAMSFQSMIHMVHHDHHWVSTRPSLQSDNLKRLCQFAPYSKSGSALYAMNIDESDLKAELVEYLQKRDELNADEVARAEVGKIIGGTRGNIVLDFVSGSPNKQRILEETPGIFDYDELIKYGYGHLVTPIMKHGGRRAMYPLMNIPLPPISEKITNTRSAPKLVIDRTGETDEARYSGLKMTQALDDDVMGRALEEAAKKLKEGKSLRKKLSEEDYVMPYANNKNKGPRETPFWTPEKLDEAGKQAGKSQAWARRAKMGAMKKDPFETLAVEGELRAYSIFTASFTAVAFGSATPMAMMIIGLGSDDVTGAMKIPASAMLAAAFGSALVNAVYFAPMKKRSSLVWAVKGLMGGPLAVRQLRKLDGLQTIGESIGNT